MLLGAVGRLLGGKPTGGAAFYLIGIFALLLAAREWGWIDFRLPERKCQTEKVWAHEFGFVVASAMWGLHIGLGFATRVTYGGFWILVAVTLALGDPIYGALLMLAYWLGRALPVWIAPVLLTSDSDAMELPGAIFANGSLFHSLVGLASVWSAGIAILVALWAQSHWLLDLLRSP